MDYEPLSKYEKNLTGHYQSQHPLHAMRSSAYYPKRSSGQSTPASKRTTDNSPASSVGSIRSIRTVGSLVTGGKHKQKSINHQCLSDINKRTNIYVLFIALYMLNMYDIITNAFDCLLLDNTPTTGNDSMNSSQISTSTQKKLKARRAFIADNCEENCKEFKRSTSVGKTKDIIESLEGNKEHLETKKQIENLRDEYGDSWLHSQGASKVHGVIGISPAPDTENYFKAGPPETTAQLIENFFGRQPSLDNDYRTSTPLTRSQNDDIKNKHQTVEVIVRRSPSQFMYEICISCFFIRDSRAATKLHRATLIIIRTNLHIKR